MCNFHSSISDGKGNVKFFKPQDVAKIMATGNPKNYDFNSHTSICHYFDIKGREEDKWNKWEYNPKTKELKRDTVNTDDDSEKVSKRLEKWFKEKDLLFLMNLYGRNTGNSNTGDRNSGDRNTGNSNTGDRNTGNSNTGDWNSGDRNSGDMNTGNSNSGDWNSGDMNSGDMNTGDMNTTYGSSGVFCTTEEKIRIFNIPSDMTLREWRNSKFIRLFNNFSVTKWIGESEMTDQEKIDNPKFYVAQGYLKTIPYKTACSNWWESLSESKKKEVQTIPNFNKEIFKEITGIEV